MPHSYSIFKVTKRSKLKKWKRISLVIDFASAESSVDSARFCAEQKIPLIVGSTGQTEEQLTEIEKCGKFVPILKCNNFSMGIQAMLRALEGFCKNGPNEVTVFETHSKSKKDSPSGTANAICNFLKQQTNCQIQVCAERAGDGFGTHKIKFYYNNEIIELQHTALSREVFVSGLEKCIEPMLNKNIAGLFSVSDIL